MRKIAVVTGSRAEYGPLKILMNAIEKDKALTLLPVVTGMHLLKNYGETYKLVKTEFPHTVKVPMILNGNDLIDTAFYLASGIENLSRYFSKSKPDIIIVAGDRSEPLAAALAALYLNIPIAHINGGDVSGTIDESIRHAITKVSHIHFAYTKENAKRIEKMGEDKHRIFSTGALSIEAMLALQLQSKTELFARYHLDPQKPTLLVVQHPITTLRDRGYSEMKELLSTLDELQFQTILIYPNCDAGSIQLLNIIEAHKKKKYLVTFKSLPHQDYINFMKTTDLMIGNSSSGIIEAPTFKIPVINIGKRQQGREQSDNIINVEPEKNKILQAVNFAFHDASYRKKLQRCKNKFGEGHASQKIIKVLKTIEINESLIQKQISY